MWVVVLLQPATIEDCHAIKVQDRVELMRDCNDGVACKPSADYALDDCIGSLVNAESRALAKASFGLPRSVKTYLLVASSRIRIELGRSKACARLNSCFWP